VKLFSSVRNARHPRNLLPIHSKWLEGNLLVHEFAGRRQIDSRCWNTSTPISTTDVVELIAALSAWPDLGSRRHVTVLWNEMGLVEQVASSLPNFLLSIPRIDLIAKWWCDRERTKSVKVLVDCGLLPSWELSTILHHRDRALVSLTLATILLVFRENLLYWLQCEMLGPFIICSIRLLSEAATVMRDNRASVSQGLTDARISEVLPLVRIARIRSQRHR